MRLLRCALPAVCLLAVAGDRPAAAAEEGPVYRVVVEGVINPIQAEYFARAFDEAERAGASLILVVLDTPGGLADSMEGMIRRMLASRAPVCAWVGPPGARAASAGFFLLVSADVAAMAPGTRAGAAHPVMAAGGIFPVGDEPEEEPERPAGGDDAAEAGEAGAASRGGKPVRRESVMMEKVMQDAQAFLRSIATQRGRDPDAAERAVTESRSYAETEAMAARLIDLVAAGEAELLEALDGREVRRLDGTTAVLRTRGRPVVTVEKTFREKALSLLTDANIAFLMFLVGALLVYVEFSHPGLVLPGVAGGILLLLAFIGFSALPLNVGGVVLLVGGLALFVVELVTPGFGVFGIGGLVATAIGGIILIDVPDASLRVDPILAVGASSAGGVLVLFLGWLVWQSRRRTKPVGGSEALVGMAGTAVTDLSPEGRVLLHGEYWTARAAEPVARGTPVRCTSREGLLLEVEPLPGETPADGSEPDAGEAGVPEVKR